MTNNNNKCPLTHLRENMIRSIKDWSGTMWDAWQYGIIVGWDKPSLKQFKKQYKWTDIQIDELKELHRKFMALIK